MESSTTAAATTTTTEVTVKKGGGERSESRGGGSDSSSGSSSNGNNNYNNNNKSGIIGKGKEKEKEKEKKTLEYFGWVYHLGTNSIGHEFCHLRFLFIRGKYVEMYKRDPHENPGIKPIRRGVAGPTLMVEELGRRKVNEGDLYVLRFYSRLDETKKGEIACATAGEAREWMEAFDHAKQQAEYELSRGSSTRNKLNMETEINLEGHRPRIRRYAHGLKKLIRIGQGPERLLRQYSDLHSNARSDRYYEGEVGDAIEAHEWKCVRTINGVRIFEDVSDSKNGKGILVKAVGVIDASADTVFEVILNVDRHQRYEWDTLTGDLELLDSYDGHYDVVYGTFDPKYLTRWQSKRDFVFSRQWFNGQDGTYTILQFPAVLKKRPPRSGYRRTKINPSTWEIRNLNAPMGSTAMRCLLTQTLEIHHAGWLRWKSNRCSKFEKTIPYALLSQVAGLKEYIGANPALKSKYATKVVHSKISEDSTSSSEYEDAEVKDEFYDAISADSSSSEESEDEGQPANEEKKVKLKNVSWAIASFALRRTSALDANKELDPSVTPINFDLSQFHGSLPKGKDEKDSSCWSSPNGNGFMIRGKTYLKDNSKVMGGDPLLKLIAVDWFKVDSPMDRVSLHPKCLVQTEAGKKLPFILVINLQIPAKPNYSMVLYYAADRPVNKSSLLGKFIDGTDMFRDSRFKLIPSITEGYWMVKRAVGTKACLLGKAVTCKYLRQDNFLEIDVDIGSSSVARSVIGLVLGYVTSLVVDLAILIEAKEEEELPEYILGTVRLNRVRLDSAVPLEV
ncbi:protein ENHANCED DISEASE RESISTANCE 2-like [Ricinus communis]|uniref:Lipid binding protein, putative n=1 Tax=Ricinus communis TaxID=3988 RepID=B9SC17_RICCO|nr:protein ENHANCED DISEASE RESISTANCE 2-like [Ricinus communis]EEF38875.1 lipid binding protein, putative [Ricinus communis]|eukprot:XP_002523536.1 protein ENHANCED DISEASE RESISTANCE 2-like [Ricinus communis]